MPMHLEFVVPGPPVSNQSGGPNLAIWRATVEAEAKKQWTKPPLVGPLKAILINFYSGNKPSLDLDNLSKPILDVLQGTLYDDDRQIIQAELTHVQIDAPMSIAGASKILVDEVQKGKQFVYVRIEDAVAPFPLPK